MKKRMKSYRIRFRNNDEKIYSYFDLLSIIKSLIFFDYSIDDIISIELIKEY